MRVRPMQRRRAGLSTDKGMEVPSVVTTCPEPLGGAHFTRTPALIARHS